MAVHLIHFFSLTFLGFVALCLAKIAGLYHLIIAIGLFYVITVVILGVITYSAYKKAYLEKRKLERTLETMNYCTELLCSEFKKIERKRDQLLVHDELSQKLFELLVMVKTHLKFSTSETSFQVAKDLAKICGEVKSYANEVRDEGELEKCHLIADSIAAQVEKLKKECLGSESEAISLTQETILQDGTLRKIIKLAEKKTA